MSLFKRGRRASAAAAVQLRRTEQHPFGVLGGYAPLGSGEIRLYRAIREAVPIVDAAILKIIRLTGGFSAKCGDSAAEAGLNEFLRTVNVGRGQRGMDAFLTAYLDSLLTCGRAVGELVLSPNARSIAALICGNAADIEIKEGATPLDFQLCARRGGIEPEPLPHQELLLFTPFCPEPDAPYGTSLLKSMPFMTEILLKIFQAMGQNWERMGNVRFAVTCPAKTDGERAEERAQQMAKEWSAAMQSTKSGSVRDFVAVGDVSIKAIGADNQILDSEVPVRQVLEQLIARTGLPPFMLGLNWSTTERMSSQQADLMTSELWAIRRCVSPVLERVCELWLRVNGCAPKFELCWDDINLQDETEQARARLYNAQAMKIEKELGI